jgi:hypothetical protein
LAFDSPNQLKHPASTIMAVETAVVLRCRTFEGFARDRNRIGQKLSVATPAASAHQNSSGNGISNGALLLQLYRQHKRSSASQHRQQRQATGRCRQGSTVGSSTTCLHTSAKRVPDKHRVSCWNAKRLFASKIVATLPDTREDSCPSQPSVLTLLFAGASILTHAAINLASIIRITASRHTRWLRH